LYARSSIARIAAGLLAASLIVLTGCSSSGSGSTGAQASGVQVSGSAFTGTTPLKSATVGILGSNMSSPTVVSLADTAKQALAAVGWKSEIVDGQGNPATAATGLTQFTTEKVAAIITIGVEASGVKPQLTAAEQAGIPVIAAAVDVADRAAFSAVYGAPSDGWVSALFSYITKTYPKGTKYVSVNLTAITGVREIMAGIVPKLTAAGYDAIGTFDINAADLTNSTRTGTLNLVQANPDAKFVLAGLTLVPPIALPALKQAGHGSLPMVVANDDLQSISDMRSGYPLTEIAPYCSLLTPSWPTRPRTRQSPPTNRLARTTSRSRTRTTSRRPVRPTSTRRHRSPST
jgi:ABC-type sugar transport system substrate-binding protein